MNKSDGRKDIDQGVLTLIKVPASNQCDCFLHAGFPTETVGKQRAPCVCVFYLARIRLEKEKDGASKIGRLGSWGTCGLPSCDCGGAERFDIGVMGSREMPRGRADGGLSLAHQMNKIVGCVAR